MPLVTTLIDDTSPLILYDNTWLPGSSATDTLASDYYLGTFTTNNVTNGTMSLNFNGTAVWIYGAKRTNHGTYSIKVDDLSFANLNGAANNVFKTPLFNQSGLVQGMHKVSLTNTGARGLFVDIDMIMWQSEVGKEGDQLETEIVEDTDPRFKYQEPAWTTTSSTLDFNLFSNGTGHATTTYQASVTFTFTAVTLYGTSGASNGLYTVRLDSTQPTTYNMSRGPNTNYGVVIYHADNLGPGSHEVTLTNLPNANGQSLSIDYAQLWTIANTSSNTSTPASGSFTSNGSTSHAVSTGAIAGIIAAAAVAFIFAGTTFFFYRRWKAALASKNEIYSPIDRRRSLDRSTFVPSSSETRSIHTVFQSEVSAVRPYEHGMDNGHMSQYGGSVVELLPSARPPQSAGDGSSFQFHSPADEVPDGRYVVEPPVRALSVSTVAASEFPRNSGLRRTSTRGRSTVVCEPPPNYKMAMGKIEPFNG